MKIRYKVLEHERVEDSPFIGAVISAIDCWDNCPCCFNQHLMSLETMIADAAEIIAEVKSNPINEGIILAGLEWTLQPEEMFNLLYTARKAELKTMLYTSMTGNEFLRWFALEQKARSPFGSGFLTFQNGVSHYLNYIKFGFYDETQKTEGYSSCNVSLASRNQYVREITQHEN